MPLPVTVKCSVILHLGPGPFTFLPCKTCEYAVSTCWRWRGILHQLPLCFVSLCVCHTKEYYSLSSLLYSCNHTQACNCLGTPFKTLQENLKQNPARLIKATLQLKVLLWVFLTSEKARVTSRSDFSKSKRKAASEGEKPKLLHWTQVGPRLQECLEADYTH